MQAPQGSRLCVSQKYCCISNTDLDDIRSISHVFPNCGYKMMMGHLKERGITVQQFRVRESVRGVDPEGSAVRFRNTLRRRQNNVMFPLELWHIDGNHKLIKYTIYEVTCTAFSVLHVLVVTTYSINNFNHYNYVIVSSALHMEICGAWGNRWLFTNSIRCATNNRVETVKDCFVQAAQKFGLPLRVRCDKEGENVSA